MYTINNDNIVESLEKMANDIQYPPLNGGPTKDDILAMLRGASAVIAELERAVEEAADKLDDIDTELTLAQAYGELEKSKAIEAIQNAIKGVHYNLREA